MFLKLHCFGEEIVVNMSFVYDFHEGVVEGRMHGSVLHFTRDVEPYGHRRGTHWKKHVDESPDQILRMLEGQ
jgi:hypothetical protein